MSMPEIPEGKYRPCIEETMIDLLESIALEEIAISHILNAEGEKLQAILGKYRCNEMDFPQMLLGTKGVERMVEDLIMKEWLLLTKLRYVSDFTQSNELQFCCATPKPCHCPAPSPAYQPPCDPYPPQHCYYPYPHQHRPPCDCQCQRPQRP